MNVIMIVYSVQITPLTRLAYYLSATNHQFIYLIIYNLHPQGGWVDRK